MLTTAALDRAMSVVARIESGEVAPDRGDSEAIAASSAATDNRPANVSLFVFAACWLFGIVDSWRLGRADDRKHASASG
jgi:hypothetical protein